ncbi:MAG TPA: HAMP domain-containing sensor histidine kinase [Micromonosporaceae bacterium]
MAIDNQVLIDGVCAADRLAQQGAAGPVVIDTLIAAYGVMRFGLGQPMRADLAECAGSGRAATFWAGHVDQLPAELADLLRACGVQALTGLPVRAGGRSIGAVHLYFGELDQHVQAELEAPVRLAAGAIGQVYGEAPLAPAVTDEEDRNLFLAMAGHELRTPVTVIKGYASMLAERWDALDDDNRREAARVLTQRADELARLVDRLLGAAAGVGTAEDGAAGWLVRMVTFDPVQALHHAVAELPIELRDKVRIRLPDGLPPATGDPALLASVVAELVTNAVRQTPALHARTRGGLTWIGDQERADPSDPVEITAGADRQTVYVHVLDRGVGIDPGDTERAFERFWRARRDGEDRGGVGLGLFLVRRLVERQQGWVSLRPRDGGGTVAEVRLLRADGPHRPPAAEEA